MQTPNAPETEVKADERPLLLDHDYDGIKELDFPLPRWWLMTFYATIVFAIGYAAYYMAGPGPTPRQELEIALGQIASVKTTGQPDDSDLQAAASNPEVLKLGQGVFAGKCAACHGPEGQGVIGPNLTDDYWLHGSGSAQDIAKTVHDGVLEKGMPAWGDALPPAELTNVVVYVKSLRGSRPSNAKPPQGELQASGAAGPPAK